MIAVIDCRLPVSCQNALAAQGFELFHLPPFSRLSAPVASHPDMLILPLGKRLFVQEDYYREAKPILDTLLSKIELSLSLIHTSVSPCYPNDIALNLAKVGKHLIGRLNGTSEELLDYAKHMGFVPVNTKQGYAKCSTVTLDNALITADLSIEKTARDHGIDTLLIREGFVSLAPYPYGFLGGATGVTHDTVYVCGSLDSHPDAEKIKAFCRKHGYETRSLSDEPLFDGGTIFFFRPQKP